MENTMLIWYSVVGGVLLAIAIEFIARMATLRRKSHRIKPMHKSRHHIKMLGMTKERDLFYIPGDRRYNDQDYDFDDM